jgi:hypothetical protein
MKRLILVVVLVFPVLTLAFWVHLGLNSSRKMRANIAKQTVQNRLDQFGPQARARLAPYFATAHVAYPPARLTLVGLKDEKTLEVYAGGANQKPQLIRSYPILAASGGPGPKLREGDQQVPEGMYGIESLNPNSSFHLSLRINYPNAFDREQAAREGRTNLGGDIMIHGGAASVGCLAMGDEAAEDLFVLAADTGIANIAVILSPVDFRKNRSVPGSGAIPAWTAALYQTIQSNLNELPAKNQ